MPLSMIFEQSWQLGEVLDDWKKVNVKVNVKLLFLQEKKEGGTAGNCKLVSLTFTPEKVMKQLILGTGT